MKRFEELIHDREMLSAIHSLGFTEPTEIQTLAIPPALEGKDVIWQAKTGSGKTLAFGIPLLRLLRAEQHLHALILAPTRELCAQIATELGKFARNKHVRITTIYGGISINPQIIVLRHAHVVVATPGRLLDHIERGTFKPEGIRFLVFDEADRMFDMRFVRDIERIMTRIPSQRQTLLFSATMPDP